MEILTKEDLLSALITHCVPIDRWGAEGTKTVDDLFGEVNRGESRFELQPDGPKNTALIRHVQVAAVVVYYRDGESLMMLIEGDREHVSGDVTRRELDTSISEKVMPGEVPMLAAQRAFREELGISDPPNLEAVKNFEKDTARSSSYPGLMTRYEMHVFVAHMPDHHFRSGGYAEHQTKKTSRFNWTKVQDVAVAA